MSATTFRMHAALRICPYFVTRSPTPLRCLHSSVRNASAYRSNSVAFARHPLCVSVNGFLLDQTRFAAVLSNSVRWNSESTTAAATPDLSKLPPGYLPEPPVAPPPGTDELVEQLTALGEPTLASLGLGSWYPNGIVQQGLEFLHVGLDVPWWTAIVIGTIIVRLSLFPLTIYAQRNAANMHNHMPMFQKLQEKLNRAKQSNNPLEGARASQQLQEYVKKNKVNPFRNIATSMAQLPVFVSVFVGIRQMANLPVESMKVGGLAWFTDLTVADPYYALPIFTMATFFITLELGVDGIRSASMTRNMKLFMRALPLVIFPFTMNFPAGMLCYWVTSNMISLLMVLFLRIPGLKTYFKIPALVAHDSALTKKAKKPFVKTVKDMWKDSQAVVDIEKMQRMEATKFKEAGFGAVPKTFTYDPTKVQKAKAK